MQVARFAASLFSFPSFPARFISFLSSHSVGGLCVSALCFFLTLFFSPPRLPFLCLGFPGLTLVSSRLLSLAQSNDSSQEEKLGASKQRALLSD